MALREGWGIRLGDQNKKNPSLAPLKKVTSSSPGQRCEAERVVAELNRKQRSRAPPSGTVVATRGTGFGGPASACERPPTSRLRSVTQLAIGVSGSVRNRPCRHINGDGVRRLPPSPAH